MLFYYTILEQHGSGHHTSVVARTPFIFTQHFVLSFLLLISPSLYTCSSGSHIENWHSVLRNGLVNASYTKLQVRTVTLAVGWNLRCISSRTVNLLSDRAGSLSGWFIFAVNGCQLPFRQLLQLAFQRAGHTGRFSWPMSAAFFFSPPPPAAADSMSLPVVGQREGAVVSAVMSGSCLCALLGSTT